MNNKGFTLVELLAVITIIALIAAFALPQVLTQFTNNADEITKKEKEMIEEAARAYVEENNATFSASSSSCIKLKDLVKADYLNESFVIDALGDSYNSSYKISVKYSSKRYTIELTNGSC